jgi:replicative DNA helicase
MKIDQVPNLEEVDKFFDHESEIVSLFEAVEKIEKEKGQKDYFPTGFRIFDDVTWGGVSGGDLITISGRSGEGKTTFAQTLSYHLADKGLPLLWFSYEMDLLEIAKKFSDMGIKKDFIGYVPMKLTSGAVDWIERRVVEAVLKFNIKAVFIDHLGFLSPKVSGDQAERNFSVYLGQIARQLKNIARDNDVIIFLLAHTRKTKEDLDLDDIAYSNGMGQESDFVFMIEREKSRTSRSLIPDSGDKFTPYTKILLAKNRRTGQTKFIKVRLSHGRLMEEIKHEPIDYRFG